MCLGLAPQFDPQVKGKTMPETERKENSVLFSLKELRRAEEDRVQTEEETRRAQEDAERRYRNGCFPLDIGFL